MKFSLESKNISYGIVRAIIILGAIVAAYFLVSSISSIIVYLMIAFVIATAGRPIVQFLSKILRFPKTLSAILTLLLFLVIILLIMSMLIPVIKAQGATLSNLNFVEIQSKAETLLKEISNYLEGYNISLFKDISISETLASIINFKDLTSIFSQSFSAIGNIGLGLFCVLFISFFFLQDDKIIHDVIYIVFPAKNKKTIDTSLRDIKKFLGKYVLGLCLQISILFALYSIILVVFNVKSAILIALFCALLNLIPYIGPLVAGVFMIFLTMINFIGLDFKTVLLPNTVYVLIGYIIVQAIDNFINQPFIFSNSSKSHPLEVFLVILIAGTWFGIIGMILAIPTYTIIKIVSKQLWPENRFVEALTKNM